MKISNVLIGLDLSSIDEFLVQSCILLHQYTQAVQKVTLFHNIRYDFLEGHIQLSEDDLRKLKKKILGVFTQKYGAKLDMAGVSYEVQVLDEDHTENALLSFIGDNDPDLLIMGLKQPMDGVGIIPQQILALDQQRTPMLLVPEGKPLGFRHLLGGIDLSEASREVVESTTALARLAQGLSSFLYIFKMPQTYFPYIDVESQALQEQTQKRASQKLQSFINSIPESHDPPSVRFETVKGAHVTDEIRAYASKHNVDLVIIQRISRPHRISQPVGGVARRFLRMSNDHALLIL